jgi:hypothetical protein
MLCVSIREQRFLSSVLKYPRKQEYLNEKVNFFNDKTQECIYENLLSMLSKTHMLSSSIRGNDR